MQVLILGGKNDSERRDRYIESRIHHLAKGVLKQRFSVMRSKLHTKVPGMWVRKTKAVYYIPDERYTAAVEVLASMIRNTKIDLIVTYDPATAQVLTDNAHGNQQNTAKIAGSTGTFMDVPFVIVDDPAIIYAPGAAKDEAKAVAEYTLSRHLLLSMTPRNVPPFVYKPAIRQDDFDLMVELANMALFIATDVESQGPLLTCVGFTFVFDVGMKRSVTMVVPLRWGNNSPWADQAGDLAAWKCILDVMASPTPKAQHNGRFDLSQMVRYGFVMNAYCLDTMLMQWSMLPTTPKSLNYCASIHLQGYVYWKDEGKTVDDRGRAKYRSPSNPASYNKYLRYNGMDCWYTARLVCHYLKQFNLPRNRDFLRNYIRTFLNELGPALYMSWHGMPLNEKGRQENEDEGISTYEGLLDEIRLWTGDPDLNPNAPVQVKKLVYDVMKLKPLPRKGKSTGKDVLSILGAKNPIAAPILNRIKDAKYARTENQRFGAGVKTWDGWELTDRPWPAPRVFSDFSAVKTKTARYASAQSVWGVGTNWQNVPGPHRRYLMSDEGTFFAFPDYSQADVWHVAAACGDEYMQEVVMTPGNDSHSIHAARFFCYPLEDVLRGKANDEPWVTDYIIGIRQLVKKVVHGSNYGLMPYGMVINIGLPAAIAIVRSLLSNEESRDRFLYFIRNRTGLVLSNNGRLSEGELQHILDYVPIWPLERLALGCEFVQNSYFEIYPVLSEFRKTGALRGLLENNRRITTHGPHTFTCLANPGEELKRFVCSLYGQAGTAGTINNAMLRFFYHEDWQHLHDEGINIVLQVHDENGFQIPDAAAGRVWDIYKMMHETAVYNGCEFTIPVELEVAKRWCKKGKSWNPNMTPAETLEAAYSIQ